jgi:glycosyltransferase involved in cell wall biosynthesis
MSRIDILLPVYNAMRFLPEWWEKNIVASTFKDVRIVAVDNGSTDGTQDYIRSWSDRMPLLFHQNAQNLGVEGSMEQGWHLFEAPYIIPLPADDWLAPDFLGDAVSALDAHDGCGFAFGRGHVVNMAEDGTQTAAWERHCPFYRPGTYRRAPLTTIAINFPTDVILIRRSEMQKIGGYTLLPHGHVRPVAALLQTVSDVWFTGKDHYYSRKHKGQVSKEWATSGRYYLYWNRALSHLFDAVETEADRIVITLLQAHKITGQPLPQLFNFSSQQGDPYYRAAIAEHQNAVLLRIFQIVIAQFRLGKGTDFKTLNGPLGKFDDAMKIAGRLRTTSLAPDVDEELKRHNIEVNFN